MTFKNEVFVPTLVLLVIKFLNLIQLMATSLTMNSRLDIRNDNC